jgi:hypothetical protein
MNKENQITLDFDVVVVVVFVGKTMLRCWRLGSETERAIIQSFALSLSLSLSVLLCFGLICPRREAFFLIRVAVRFGFAFGLCPVLYLHEPFTSYIFIFIFKSIMSTDLIS